PLVSIVLSVFMGGLALGSWLVGRLTRRLEAGPATPLRLYALAELLISLSGLVVPAELEWGRRLLGELGTGIPWGSSAYYLASGAWIALTLLPFGACMGATFPLAMAAIGNVRADGRRSFSYLYFANVLGAASGTVVSAFVLIDTLGFRGTLRAAASLNALLAVSAFSLSFAATRRQPSRDGTRSAPSPRGPGVVRSRPATLGLLFATGLTSMAMEVVWIRQFTPYLGTVVYAFATILAVYLAATSLGSSAYRVWSRSHGPDDASAFQPWVWTVVGLAGLILLLAADPRVSAL